LNWSTASGVVNESMEKIFLMSKCFQYSHYKKKPSDDLGTFVCMYVCIHICVHTFPNLFICIAICLYLYIKEYF
jgi:hypothetical protein